MHHPDEAVLHMVDIIVVAGTPSNHSPLIKLNQPVFRARYGFRETAESGLNDLVHQFAFEKALE
ncbi:MAG: hypothetical protein JXQ99_02515 [Hyphomicrobiaceae bacterium]